MLFPGENLTKQFAGAFQNSTYFSHFTGTGKDLEKFNYLWLSAEDRGHGWFIRHSDWLISFDACVVG